MADKPEASKDTSSNYNSLVSELDKLDSDKLDFSVDKSEFVCNICTDLLFEPATLHCGHTYCLSCLKGVAREDLIKSCPGCITELDIPIDNIKKNIKLHNLMKLLPGYKERSEKSEKQSKFTDLLLKFRSSKLYIDMYNLVLKTVIENKFIYSENLIQGICIDFDFDIYPLKTTENLCILIKLILSELMIDKDIIIINDILFTNHFDKVLHRYILNNLLSLSSVEVCYMIGIGDTIPKCNLMDELTDFEMKNRDSIFNLLDKCVGVGYNNNVFRIEFEPNLLVLDRPDDEPIEI